MSHLNGVRDEMESLLGSIAADAKVRSLILFLRSSEIGLMDCLKITKQMQKIIVSDNEFKAEELVPTPQAVQHNLNPNIIELMKPLQQTGQVNPLNGKPLIWPPTQPKDPT